MVDLKVGLDILQRLGLAEVAESDPLTELYIKHREFYDMCESPIEKAFWSVAYFALKDEGELIPQYFEEPYFIDFALVKIPGVPRLKVAIELDGHDYHKTKEQRDKDTERERYLMRRGWQVIRFTGTQIHQDAGQCVEETIALIQKFKYWLRTG